MSEQAYLFDTNVLSELRRPRPDPRVLAFYDALDDACMFTSVMALGELRRGAELKLRKDVLGGAALVRWIEAVETSFADRVIGIDREVARLWGRLSALRPRPVVDTLLAATAIVHGMTLVTRNVADMKDTGVALIDPWGAAPSTKE